MLSKSFAPMKTTNMYVLFYKKILIPYVNCTQSMGTQNTDRQTGGSYYYSIYFTYSHWRREVFSAQNYIQYWTIFSSVLSIPRPDPFAHIQVSFPMAHPLFLLVTSIVSSPRRNRHPYIHRSHCIPALIPLPYLGLCLIYTCPGLFPQIVRTILLTS